MNRPMEFLARDETSQLSRADLKLRARRALQLRQFREQLFGPSISKEVAWDMLLALYSIDRKLTVGRLTRAADASMTTVLRWLDYLEERELIQRFKNPLDSRAVFICLTEAAERLMDTYILEAMAKRG